MTEAMRAERLARWTDPAALHRIVGSSAEHTFWLDAGPSARRGWSYVGVGRPEADGSRVRELVAGASAGRGTWEAGPFRGGWIGWITYERGAAALGAPIAGEPAAAGGECWMRAAEWYAFDHARRLVWAVGPAARIDALVRAAETADEVVADPRRVRVGAPASARHDPAAYAALIDACRDAIREGEAYQLCLTTRFSVAGRHDPTAVFERLRRAHDAPYGGLVRCGGATLAAASPESFLRVADGTVKTSPIKGTRRRGATPEEDRALVEDLRSSEKERAENVMIVDLMRNDLSRVCVDGTVGVDSLFAVESHPAVHQLVSTVSGTLAPGVTVGDVLDAAFPAGSMTGAPKLSAMTILHRLEDGPRGIFSGCFGWIGVDGSLDLGMVIRSIVFEGESAYVGAGGGITWRSEPWAEVEEVALKARGPLGALGADLPHGWRTLLVG